MNHVVQRFHCVVLAGCLALIAACAPHAKVDSLQQQGRVQLAPQQLLELLQGNTLAITTFGEDVSLYFDPSGRLFGQDYEQNRDSGRWDVSEGGELCLKFGKWWYGDMRCFTVWPEGNRYLFMRGDGGLAYHATRLAANPAPLAAMAAAELDKNKQRASFRKTAEEGDESTAAAPGTEPVAARPDGKRSSYRGTLSAGDTAPTDSAPASTATAAAPAPAPLTAPMSGGELKNTVRWLARDCPGCNMAQADLRGADLVAADLKGADLRGANLREANLRRAKLQGANLETAVLEHANLPGADLKGANLRGANLRGANLIRADLTGADLHGADLSGALLEGATGIK